MLAFYVHFLRLEHENLQVNIESEYRKKTSNFKSGWTAPALNNQYDFNEMLYFFMSTFIISLHLLNSVWKSYEPFDIHLV